MCLLIVKKKLERMVEGDEVEAEVRGGEEAVKRPENNDDVHVVGPPLPPGYKVRELRQEEGEEGLENELSIEKLVEGELEGGRKGEREGGRGERRLWFAVYCHAILNYKPY